MSSTPGVVREFVGLPSPTARRAGAGGHPCQGLYYRGVGRKPKVAMIAAHYQIDFSEHYLAEYMATRGIGFLGWNTRFRGFESSFLLDHALVDIGVGVQWLREVQGVETVVLLGNSGGGSLMAAYQSQANEPNVVPLAGMRPAAGLNDLLPADGYVASAAHPGRPDVLTAWMDGAVVDENDPVATDPELDIFDERAQTRAEPHLARVNCPALVINAEADTGVFPSDAQRIYDALASDDKAQVSIDTDHYFTTSGARSEQADTIAKWIAKRWR
jgi:pimeloyl-ACP methyl ester carboxylesterase